MTSKKNIGYYRDAGYPIPALTWLLNQIWVYIAMALAGALALAHLCYTTVTAADEIKNPPKPPSAFQQVKLNTSKAMSWAKAFVAKAPPKQGQWNATGTPRLEQPLTFKECDALGLPSKNLLGSFTGGNDSITTKAQVYTAGNAVASYNDYQRNIASCGDITKEHIGAGRNEVEITNYKGGFFFTLGDAIIFVQGDSKDELQPLKEYYVNKARSTLSYSECRSLQTSPQDGKRNLFTSGKNYTGLIAHENITTAVNLSDIPNAVYPSVKETTEATQPEGPLPASFKKLPKAMEQPNIPADPEDNKPQVEKGVAYQIKDVTGPGCGWNWAGGTAPVLDEAALKANQDRITKEAQTLVDGNATKYVNDKLAYSRSLLDVMANVAQWNKYVDEVNAVHSQWQWLTTQRNALETPWYNYVQQHDAWVNFDNQKANAIKEYNAQVTTCNKQNQDLQDWKDQWSAAYEAQQREKNKPTPSESESGSPSSTASPSASPSETSTASPTASPTPSGSSSTAPSPTASASSTASATPSEVKVTPSTTVAIPPMPQGCTTSPEIPSIAQENKGDEPQAPKIPENVTIPASWPKPIKEPTVALEK